MIYVLFLLYVILASSGLILFKLGSNGININFIKGLNISINWISLLGILCYMISFILWLVIVSKSKLTWAFPLSVALINTIIFVTSAIIFKETISTVQIVGVILISIGVGLIGIKAAA